ncbi:hypothetical protein PENARI_c010G08513 [Penicillium arizonense]|uniref:Uncharacterized protein n=1 Tax=Penicillium arizonense TaxID=1835702 RepID=A0A1F5LGR6_PENAI|nr:hypothetical protein PENARI_c010G08513 [Penicillium arizonense]OGE52402.1 hypothetical protein PENARI_c010G08513 [Penicillium arizonense]
MSSKLDPSALKYALFLCCGRSVASHEQGASCPLAVLDQAESPDFEEQLRSEAPAESKGHSPLHVIPLDSTPTISSRGPTDMVLHHQPEPIYFRHDITTGHSVYMFLQAKSDLRNLVHGLYEGLRQSEPCSCTNSSTCRCKGDSSLHPLALHSAILFYILSTRSTELDNLVKWLLWIETQLHQGSLFEITDSDRFSKYVQLLHKMSRNLITLEHNNQRDTSNIDHLLQDHTRLGRLAKRYNGGANIKNRVHDRVRDDLLALRDFCEDRHRRILNLRQRTNNFITLLYNLITGHDSTVNLRIATQSASIAREARKDSMSMKIIAAVTLIYLPATFVCSLFGTNLVAFDTSPGSTRSDFVVSRWWWLYLAFAVPLTVLTIFGFWLWRRFRETPRVREKKYTD